MARIKVRYLEERKTRAGTAYYWCCKRAAKFGLQASVPLGMDAAIAVAKAQSLNDLFDEIRHPAAPMVAGPKRGTLGWMMDHIEASEYFEEMSKKQRAEITAAFKELRGTPMAKAPMSEISGEMVESLHRKIKKDRSLDIAARTCKWLRWTFNKAKKGRYLLTANPMDGLRIQKPAPRQIYWFGEEIAIAVAKAEELGMPSIGLAIQIAFDTGQREGDVLRMKWSQFDDGDVRVKQRKTDATVLVPALPELAAALNVAPKKAPEIVVNENTGAPYKPMNFMHKVAVVIEAAGLKGKKFGDLRRSAVVRLAQAGCTIPEIAAITGHSYARCETILQVYLPRTTPMARAAIQKLLDSRKAA